MNKRGVVAFIFILGLFVILPFISAVDTEIKIKTVPFGNVNINVLDPDSETFSSLKRFNADANNYGDVFFVYENSKDEFDLSVYVKRNDKRLIYETYGTFEAGEDIYLEVAPEDSKLFYAPNETEDNDTVVNNTVNNETEENGTVKTDTEPESVPATIDTTDEIPEQTPGITGAATDNTNSKGIFSSAIVYFILGFLVLGAIVVTGALKLKQLKKEDYSEGGKKKEIKVKKLSEKLKEMKDIKKEAKGEYGKAIEEAEEKIKQAQKELNKLKNAEKIKELKKQIEENKKELEDLEGED